MGKGNSVIFLEVLTWEGFTTMNPTKKSALRAIKILRAEIYNVPLKRIEMSQPTFRHLREMTKTDLFDLEEDALLGDLGSLDGVSIRENNAIPFGKARVF